MNDAGVKFDDRNGGDPAGSRNEEERTTAQPLKDNYAPDGFATDALDETHMLLAYAASAGINIEPEVSEAIARARAANEKRSWNADIEAKFWPAKSKLSFSVKPVTVDTLAAGKFGAANATLWGWVVAFAWFMNDHHGDGIVSVACKALPGENAASSPPVTNISGAPVSWSTQLTTMSNPAR